MKFQAQVSASAGHAILDRTYRFAKQLVEERGKGGRAEFHGLTFEIFASDGKQVVRVKRDDDRILVRASRDEETGALWKIEKSSAPDVMKLLPGLLVAWKQRFDLEKFKDAHVRRTTSATVTTATS
ncbi:MAG TPA: hypothetical protein VFP46_02240 [Candidatus Paceibacterota bacterium]|nr:hypothetical protein [Candidatus Paceibacterota bacterium]